MRKSELQEWPRSGGRASSRPRAQDAETGPDQADLAAAGGPASAAGVLALQRTAGNAAVTQALGARRHDRGGALPVQRALRNNQREYGITPGLLMSPRQSDQNELERVFPRDENGAFQQFPDPVTLGVAVGGKLNKLLHKLKHDQPEATVPEAADWVKGINPRFPEGGGYRRNCVDAARSFVASWSGNPTVAVGVVGTTDQDVERGGNDRTATWLATRWKTDEAVAPDGQPVADVWARVAARLLGQGHGAVSIVVFKREENGNVHAVCAVNHENKVVWVDPQVGQISVDGPMYRGTAFMTITLSPQFTPVDAPPPQPTALSL
ncbi:toxin glutamine deamidase domain-containing protein [Actinomadura chibensis]|uniref:Tox-PL domain-containing protein n=1 Tax=Actinomadura chibensis TaxID=392828 RepID=A0A5D0NIP1_9ACTN|nr:toxin glutamine deamidase domain-containing protein [Actinomadura chibensis]TYB44071.1 hypothetical protein FXF69_24250 [Actinomadura chibensis]